jgi:hypothetical protein
MNVMNLMVVSLAGWINQQQEDVIDQRTGSSSRSSDQRWKGEVNCQQRLGGLLRYHRDAA